MIPLSVHVQDSATKQLSAWAFADSPVRIGRHPLNDVPLPGGFVSQWHLVVRFDATGTKLVDVGSTNGTLVDGRPIPRHLAVEVTHATVICVGTLTIRLVRAPVPDSALSRGAARSAFRVDGPDGGPLSFGARSDRYASGARGGAVARRTVFITPGGRADVGIPKATILAGVGSGGGSSAETGPEALALERMAHQLAPLESAHQANLAAFASSLEAALLEVNPSLRGPVVDALTKRLPTLMRTTAARRVAVRVGVDAAWLDAVDVHDWIARLVFEGPIPEGLTMPPVGLVMERVGALLEAFSQAYLDLRSGQEQFASELGIRIPDEGGVAGARNVRALVQFLLEPTADARQRQTELARAFAELALHQLGLVQGVVESTRLMLSSLGLEPGDHGEYGGLGELGEHEARAGAIVPHVPKSSWWNPLVTLRNAARWNRFASRRSEMLESDRFTRDLFGRRFVRAYVGVLGRNVDAASR